MAAIDTKALARKLAPPAAAARGRLALLWKKLTSGVGSKRLEQFYFQLSTMLGAGVGIRQSLHTLAGQHRGRAARVFGEIAEQVQAGNCLSPLMERRPEVFGTFAPAMVRAAESTGRLDESLALVARTLERFRRIRSQVMTALLYPAVLLHLSVLIWNFHVLFFAGVPAYARRVLSILLPIYGFLVLAWVVHELLRDSSWFGSFVLTLFVFGGVSRKSALARFARSLSALYESGVPLPAAVEISAALPANGAMRRSLAGIVPALMSGMSMADALDHAPHVTPMVRNMVTTGEQSGRLGLALDKIADYYDDEAEAAIQRMARVVPLFIYLVVIGGIGWNIVSFYKVYFERMPRF